MGRSQAWVVAAVGLVGVALASSCSSPDRTFANPSPTAGQTSEGGSNSAGGTMTEPIGCLDGGPDCTPTAAMGGAAGSAGNEPANGGVPDMLGESGAAGANAAPPAGPTCGDGKLDADERCDDGGTEAGDGCSATCQTESGWSCDEGDPSHCTSICGDGLVVGTEGQAGGCDDHNTSPLDGCNGSCKVETGYVCSGHPSVCAKTCGNGSLDPGETCDDTNAQTGDGCTACAVESGFSCDKSEPSKCSDINECTANTDNCSANANCTNTTGSFTCKCRSGYAGNGVTCSDVDECAANTDNCDANATCTNTGGSFSCACKAGYTGNGVTCVRTSCQGLANNCGASEDCCAYATVPAGSFKIASGSITANVSAFALDKYEVTVGRFKKFQSVYAGPPASSAGANPLLSGSGWSATWNGSIASTKAVLASAVVCPGQAGAHPSFTAGSDVLPMNCVDWYEAFAFCAWDGGWLPSDVQLRYARAGGDKQWTYPWGNTPVPTDMVDSTAAYLTYDCLGDGTANSCVAADILAVGSKPLGLGRFGQYDLSGSVAEWVLDSPFAVIPSPCNDCANYPVDAASRINHDGGWSSSGSSQTSSSRLAEDPLDRSDALGFRCARAIP